MNICAHFLAYFFSSGTINYKKINTFYCFPCIINLRCFKLTIFAQLFSMFMPIPFTLSLALEKIFVIFRRGFAVFLLLYLNQLSTTTRTLTTIDYWRKFARFACAAFSWDLNCVLYLTIIHFLSKIIIAIYWFFD